MIPSPPKETKNASGWCIRKGVFPVYIVLCPTVTVLWCLLATSFHLYLFSIKLLHPPSTYPPTHHPPLFCFSAFSKKVCRCFLAVPCPMEMPVPVQRTVMPVLAADSVPTFSKPETRACDPSTSPTQFLSIWTSNVQVVFFVFFHCNFPFLLPSTHSIPSAAMQNT